MEQNIKKDEHYVLFLCDKVLGRKSLRQYKFDFLRGDEGKKGIRAKLPVDAYYEELNLVIEYKEKQHTEVVSIFERNTISGVNRTEQRKIYDERRREVLPKYGITLIEISYFDFNYNSDKRIIRNISDEKIIRQKLKNYL